MKKVIVISWFAILLNLITWITHAKEVDLSDCKKTIFSVTAYYSPLPNQKFFIKWDFAKETKLNGQGIVGASGKRVFNGMIAAPTKYKFGTKIYLPQLGRGEVADRGGAIVAAGQRGEKYDRLDLWFWRWEEALIKAISFGKKKIVGYVCPENQEVQLGFDLSKIKIYDKFFEKTFWIVPLYAGRKDPWVTVLQKHLVSLWYLTSNDITGYFGSRTKKAVCEFQKDYKVVSANSPRCGYFGPKTRWALKLALLTKGEPLIPDLKISNSMPLVAFAWNVSVLTDIKVVFEKPFKKGERWENVKTLQKLLKKEKLFQGEINGIFDKYTMDSLFEFQKKYWILNDNAPLSLRGYMWPSTRKKLNERIKYWWNKYLKDKEKLQKIANTQFTKPYKLNEKAEEIKTLQLGLKLLGYYNWSINGKYTQTTMDAVFKFQLDTGILDASSPTYLHGYFGPQTRKEFSKVLRKVIESKIPKFDLF